MTKPAEADASAELGAELSSAMLSAFGSMFEHGEGVNIRTHNGAVFEGVVEDSNLAGVVVRTVEDRLFFVSFSGIESAEIFESDAEDGDGERAERDNVVDAKVEDVPSRAA